MKTILQRCKTLIADNSGPTSTLSYVKDTEVIHPDMAMINITGASLPKVVFTPISTSERWVSSGKKESLNIISAYMILEYHQRESSIMGDSTRPGGQGKGIVDFALDFVSLFRGQRFSIDGSIPYLDKPTDIKSIEYFKTSISEDASLLVAEVIMECSRLFVAVPLPGDV